MNNNYIIIAIWILSSLLPLLILAIKNLSQYKEREKPDYDIKITSNSVEIMANLQAHLISILNEWNFDRIAIYQYHNGGVFSNGVSMKKYSLTYEETRRGINKIIEPSQGLFLSIHPHMVSSLNMEKIIVITKGENNPEVFETRLKELDIVQLIVLPFKDPSGNLIGSMSLHMVNKPLKVTNELKESLIMYSKRISTYLLKSS